MDNSHRGCICSIVFTAVVLIASLIIIGVLCGYENKRMEAEMPWKHD